MDSVLLEEHDDDIWVLTLNRPDSYNAINIALRDALLATIQRAERSGARAVVLRGAGRGFSAGIDLNEFAAPRGPELMAYMNSSTQALVRAVLGCPLPVVTAVHGACAGVALVMALGADHCVAATDARLVAPFMKMGLIPDGALTHLLPRLAGMARAKRLLLGGEITACDAVAIGMIAEAVASEELDTVARRRAAELATIPPAAFAYTKALLQRSFELDLEGALFEERAGQALVSTTPAFAPVLRRSAPGQESKPPETT
jgi:enoyl-CoA hydratase/carnithine racemase